MKILRIALRNIASIAGTQIVDFTEDPLRSTGLYSICGPTGAGKSSLLDAMCLALYETTPRLERIGRLTEVQGEKPNDPRALLRRGTAEGFAEVSFCGIDGEIWTARWNVRRSYGKADGALQNTEMALFRGMPAPGENGQLEVSGNKSDVRDAIREKVGLTFGQFTRAVLLAQNEFAQFLKAEDKERAAILQLLTGTELFEQISVSVYRRYADERRQLDALTTLESGMVPLSAEERITAEQRVQAVQSTLTQIDTRLADITVWVKWYEQLRNLSDQQFTAQRDLAEVTGQRTIADTRQRTLQITETVLRGAKVLRTNELRESGRVASVRHQLSEKLIQSKRAALLEAELQILHFTADADRVQLIQQSESLHSKFEKGRELKLLIDVSHQQVERLRLETEELTNAVDAQQKKFDTVRANDERLAEKIANLLTEFKSCERFEPVQDRAEFFERLVKEAIDQKLNWQQRTQDRIQAEASLSRCDQQLKSHQAHTEKLATQIRDLLTRKQPLDDELSSFDDEANLKLIQQQRIDVSDLGTLSQWLEQLSSIEQNLHDLTEQESRIRIDLQKANTDQQRLQVELLTASAVAKSATETFERMKTAIDDAAVRLRFALQNGHECPVCGSTDHPYSQNPPHIDAIALSVAESAVSQAAQKRDDLQSELARTRADIRTTGQMLEQVVPKITALNQQRTQKQETIAGHRQYSEFAPVTDVTKVQITAQIAILKEQLQKLEAHEVRILAIRKQAGLLQKELVSLQKVQAEHADKERSLQIEISQCHERSNVSTRDELNAAARFQQVRLELKPLFESVAGSERRFDDSAESFLCEFSSSIAKCRSIRGEIQSITSSRELNSKQLSVLEEGLRGLKGQQTTKQNELDTATKQLNGIILQRSTLFDGLDPEQVEQQLKVQLTTAIRKVEEARLKLDQHRLSVASMNAETRSLEESLTLAEQDANSAKGSVDSWIEQATQLADSERSREFIDGVLSRDDDWVRTEKAWLDRYLHQVSERQGRLTQIEAQIAVHRESRSDVPDFESLAAEHADLLQQRISVEQELDAAKAVISTDAANIQKNLALAASREAQELRIRPWERLNELIGSADGAKFRVIAQRRTLDILLSYANAHLDQLSPRYRLERSSESLNLSVVDRDMGDERRSVHSLSGGETFLASLALALGLASLASNRLRIESLFIDEGFGSLDPDTLNTAIGALMQLEAQGRKVGVISHVSEMADAIPVQIRIQRQRAGASKIVVPGSKTPQPAEPTITTETDLVGIRILELLREAAAQGKPKLSSTNLRATIGCSPAEFRKGQKSIEHLVEVDGRSLKLKS
ncbi:MAG: AAA family ATPase [Planctomyces sp.]|nr:AAA family ATPase [Planctomyces sp.]